MAIKISNTTVIDNDRNFTNANNGSFIGTSHIKLPSGNTAQRPASPLNGGLRYNTENGVVEGYVANSWNSLIDVIDLIETPTNVDPANAATEIANTNPILEGSPYYHVYGKPKANGQWQISTSNTFNTTVVNATVSGNSVTYTTSVSLSLVPHFWRVRYQDTDGVWSNWSTPTSFTPVGYVAPPTIGSSYCGGFYAGDIDVSGTCYRLIVAPNATGCACCRWKTTNTATPNTTSCVNGYTNTYGPLTDSTHPAGNWTATRTIGGYSDWYLPSINEITVLFASRNSMPTGERFTGNNPYWSSTSTTNADACSALFGINSLFPGPSGKCFQFYVRAIRRVPV
jgi:hypothetical protein